MFEIPTNLKLFKINSSGILILVTIDFAEISKDYFLAGHRRLSFDNSTVQSFLSMTYNLYNIDKLFLCIQQL